MQAGWLEISSSPYKIQSVILRTMVKACAYSPVILKKEETLVLNTQNFVEILVIFKMIPGTNFNCVGGCVCVGGGGVINYTEPVTSVLEVHKKRRGVGSKPTPYTIFFCNDYYSHF